MDCLMKMRIWLVLACLSLLISAGWYYRHSAPAGKPQPRQVNIRAQTVSQSLAEPSIKLVSKLAANRSVVISPEVTGRIVKIAVRSGQQVKQGDVLIALDAGKQQAELAEQSASVRDESRKLRDMRRLVARGAITTSELEGQEATVAQAQARADAAKYELSLRTLLAPFDGSVSLIDLSEGALVNSGDTLLHLDELAKLRLDLAVPERYLSLLRPGMAVTATSSAWPDQSFRGVLETLDSRVSNDTQNIKARVIIPNPDGQLRPGMLLNVELSLPPQKMTLIPAQSVEYAGEQRFVYRLEPNGKVKRVPVVLGDTHGEEVWVTEGLKVGDRIVVEGLVNLRDGVSVHDLAEVKG
ncbi:TPA: efflux RND transporter periplasmic adaptor subunit [Aeromonas hydrophila]|jgi:RND family efflux transporter MFP subunit|uniref:Efflux RND transporter periplasmic adaptor subunit n=3 Tax=Aeromonas hydrophila TaxID=644 RepID=A0AAD3YLZ1_AERHY|nr:efflux RND transporter periplasmic adaptor subunit [Aeromonas sp. ASNIH4]AWA05741.1 efflux RND transporter periplasmic adaptor subunit [Aeromonas hydrophila subsp. hydrophila]EIS3739137.1 efflux RND transporter periplasmic adaptor subunit [Aeromonas hydrophila]MBM0438342.1 efflux RND transporter periplasmic adaptor subunit [Aeromonas hydrophila subsp. ranae]POV87358.1 efflux RND transporter periplasmic adaptor subunit [Aeromonas sp. ASNIH6]QJT13407.1 efflux RND transporter periplasmic adapt